jgi:hypothetical protein
MRTELIIKEIDGLDLSEIKCKLTMPNEKGGFEWPEKETDEALLEYKTFLKSVIPHLKGEIKGERPSPNMIADIVWHTHILFTKKYHADCERIFGHYLHHQPIVN